MNKFTRLISIILILAISGAFLAGCDAQKAAENVQNVLDIVETVSDILSDDSSAEVTPAPTAAPAPTAKPSPAPTAKPTPAPTAEPKQEEPAVSVTEDGWYYTKDEVALYIHTYGKLPGNFVSKKDAEKAGWKSGSLEKYLPGKVIGGSRFGNYEGILPDKQGRVWTECDINTLGKSKRGAERIVFSNDGLVYYTGDHYESFELLYGNPEA